jgi:hypothetical protein
MGKVQQLIIDTLQQGGKVSFGDSNTGLLFDFNGNKVRCVSWSVVDGMIGKNLLRIAPRVSGMVSSGCMTIVSA